MKFLGMAFLVLVSACATQQAGAIPDGDRYVAAARFGEACERAGLLYGGGHYWACVSDQQAALTESRRGFDEFLFALMGAAAVAGVAQRAAPPRPVICTTFMQGRWVTTTCQ